MLIRSATPQDQPEIQALMLDAFGMPEGPVIAKLAADLMADATAQPLLALVAAAEAKLLGMVIYSAVTVSGHEGDRVSILAPLAVARAAQRRGVGQALVRHGLDLLKKQGASLALVLGDPHYYSRFGFTAGHRLVPPYPLPYPEAWMALELIPETLARVQGPVRCARSLHAPEHW